jgi:hypothetical protein
MSLQAVWSYHASDVKWNAWFAPATSRSIEELDGDRVVVKGQIAVDMTHFDTVLPFAPTEAAPHGVGPLPQADGARLVMLVALFVVEFLPFIISPSHLSPSSQDCVHISSLIVDVSLAFVHWLLVVGCWLVVRCSVFVFWLPPLASRAFNTAICDAAIFML